MLYSSRSRFSPPLPAEAMASSSRALGLSKLAARQFGNAPRLQQQSLVASRILAPSTRSISSATSRTTLNSRIRPVALQFRRQLSDAPTPLPTPPKKAGKIRKTLRWTWRLTYLSILGTIAYVSYEVWESRHPENQVAPDPSKKTLVILGECVLRLFNHVILSGLLLTYLLHSRHRLGFRGPPQEARYRKLQCRRYLAP